MAPHREGGVAGRSRTGYLACVLHSVLESPVLRWGPPALTAFFLAAVAGYAVKAALFGRTRVARVDQLGGSAVLSKAVMESWFWATTPIVQGSIKVGLHPDVFTWTSLVLQAVAALLVASGYFALGGWVLVFGAFCDALDGAVARARGIASEAGEVLDAAIDRWAEMIVFAGYAYYYRDLPWAFALAAGASAGAVMVSYARAKAEGYGIDARMGLMQRHERAAWLSVATVFSGSWETWHPSSGFALHPLVLAALGAICVLGNWTGWLRTRYTRAELRRR